jgi:nitrogen fixation/metabolism regulation signal transduction histidine kinase
MDVDEAFAPVRAFGQRVAVTAAAVTLVVSLLVILLASLLVRPIQRLIDGARRVSAGQVDVLVAVGTHDEFRELADSFNEMTRGQAASARPFPGARSGSTPEASRWWPRGRFCLGSTSS